MLEVARTLSQTERTENVLFLGFTGEEKGLWGAGYFVNNPTVDLERAKAMRSGRMAATTMKGAIARSHWPRSASWRS